MDNRIWVFYALKAQVSGCSFLWITHSPKSCEPRRHCACAWASISTSPYFAVVEMSERRISFCCTPHRPATTSRCDGTCVSPRCRACAFWLVAAVLYEWPRPRHPRPYNASRSQTRTGNTERDTSRQDEDEMLACMMAMNNHEMRDGEFPAMLTGDPPSLRYKSVTSR